MAWFSVNKEVSKCNSYIDFIISSKTRDPDGCLISHLIIIPLQANREFAATYPATKFIQKYVPNARLLEQIGSEVIYVLPTDDPAVVKKFEQLFAVLDRYMAKLRIKSYGLSDTTLEEVMGIKLLYSILLLTTLKAQCC